MSVHLFHYNVRLMTVLGKMVDFIMGEALPHFIFIMREALSIKSYLFLF